jgi:apolipoprotein N-acyltransferase
MCAFRSAEFRRTLVLVSNNGISAVTGPDGRVRGTSTPADEPAWLLCDTTLCDSTSPFTLVGELAAWGIGAAAVVTVLLIRRRAAPSVG